MEAGIETETAQSRSRQDNLIPFNSFAAAAVGTSRAEVRNKPTTLATLKSVQLELNALADDGEAF